MHPWTLGGRRRPRILTLAALLAVVVPGVVSAHAELSVATPPDGATIEGGPTEVAGAYTQDLTIDGSSLLLRDASGTVIAKGAVDPNDPRRLVIADLPMLAPGAYEVRWTTTSAEDDEVARGTWVFTVVAAATPAPSATTAPTPTAIPTPTTGPSPTESPAGSLAPPTPPAAQTPGPSASLSDPGSDAAATLLPIVAAFAIVAVAAVALLARRGRTTPRA